MSELYKAEVVFADGPKNDVKITFNFYQLSPETLTPIKSLNLDEATQVMENSGALKVAYQMLSDLTKKMEDAGIPPQEE